MKLEERFRNFLYKHFPLTGSLSNIFRFYTDLEFIEKLINYCACMMVIHLHATIQLLANVSPPLYSNQADSY